ncbi:unnamed protein product [Amoebophrya sp. A120]|nr:unnamed protein product [Amoebophrya sp. A120]|eukprot:GSA120T00000774001.1
MPKNVTRSRLSVSAKLLAFTFGNGLAVVLDRDTRKQLEEGESFHGSVVSVGPDENVGQKQERNELYYSDEAEDAPASDNDVEQGGEEPSVVMLDKVKVAASEIYDNTFNSAQRLQDNSVLSDAQRSQIEHDEELVQTARSLMRDSEGLTNGCLHPPTTAFGKLRDATGHLSYSCWWKDASVFPWRRQGCYYGITAALAGVCQNPKRAHGDCCEEVRVPGQNNKCRRVKNALFSCPKYEAIPGFSSQTAWFR